jgi:threonine synthase
MDTVAGRALLPAQYSQGDAVHNLGHAALLVAALIGGDLRLLAAAMDDRLHEPYRAALFPQLPALLEAARGAGAYGACLSGGGSTVLSFCREQAPAVAAALRLEAAQLDLRGRVEIVDIDRRGAQVRRSPLAERVVTAPVAEIPASLEYSLVCRGCGAEFPLSHPIYRCSCGEPLEVLMPPPSARVSGDSWRRRFDRRLGSLERLDRSGVWRFREVLLPLPGITPISRPEGQTNCYPVGRGQVSGGHRRVGAYAGIDELWLKHEGENPTGSFKDRGMTIAVTIAAWLGARAVACASTGNTSAAMAAYAAQAGLPAIVLLPEGKVASGKLSQALAYGAEIRSIAGDFDQAMSQVEELAARDGIYLLNSLNPFRLVGQQSLALELLQQLSWEAPDWIVLPAGNLGNTAALGMGLQLALRLGLVAKLPRIAAIQAAGANPFYRSFRREFLAFEPVQAATIATAINIGNPVSYHRAELAIRATGGVVEQVSDEEILAAKAVIDGAGLGCEPASAAAVAGLRRLVQEGIVRSDERIVAVLTGNLLKDPATVSPDQKAVSICWS